MCVARSCDWTEVEPELGKRNSDHGTMLLTQQMAIKYVSKSFSPMVELIKSTYKTILETYVVINGHPRVAASPAVSV